MLKTAKITDYDKIRVTNFFSNDDKKFKNEVFAKKPMITHYRLGSKIKWFLLMGSDNFWKPIQSHKWDLESILERINSDTQLRNLAEDIYHNLIVTLDKKSNLKDTTFILARGEGI